MKHLSYISLFVMVLLAACAAAPQSSPAATPSPITTPTAGKTFKNPVIRVDFPDPFILKEGGTFYAYATNSLLRRIQLSTSTDMVTWSDPVNALPELPKWALNKYGLTWAPEVIKIGDRFVMYYTTRDLESDKQCIGVATSASPAGPFQDTSQKPIVCQADLGGSIDPDPFRDGDKLYLYFKNDGNCCAKPTHIYVQDLAPDGLSVTGEPTDLIKNDQPWEGFVIEAPTMFKHDGRYYLFFSANDYGGAKYAVGYATCDSPAGPCQQAPENPILKSKLDQFPFVIGPGHQALFQLGNQTWIFYHAWESNENGEHTQRRQVWLDRLDWVDGKPVVRGPTTQPQPVPSLE